MPLTLKEIDQFIKEKNYPGDDNGVNVQLFCDVLEICTKNRVKTMDFSNNRIHFAAKIISLVIEEEIK